MVFYSARSLSQHLLFLPLPLYLYIEQVKAKFPKSRHRESLKHVWAFLKGLAVSATTGSGPCNLWSINVKKLPR